MTTGELERVLTRETPSSCVTQMIGSQRVDLAGGEVAVITLARPDRHNALTLDGWRRTASVVKALASEPAVRVIIIRGAGTKAFAAGADISEFPAQRLGSAKAAVYNQAVAEAIRSVQHIPVPVIAMVQGYAVGGGCELAAACDVRIASSDARFGIPIGTLGVFLGLAETRAVANTIGAANLKYLVYSGRLIDSTQAMAWGLVQQTTVRAQLAKETAALARSIIDGSAPTIRATKQVTALAADPAVTADHELLARLHEEIYDGDDLREGVDAFLHGRAPRFRAEGG